MSGDESTRAERRLANAMASFDDRLAAGRETPTDELAEVVGTDLLPEWERLSAFLTLVEQAWPRDTAEPDRRTEPAPTGAVDGSAPADTRPTGDADRGRFGRSSSRGTRRCGGKSRSRFRSLRP
jgi:hypothetical protein